MKTINFFRTCIILISCLSWVSCNKEDSLSSGSYLNTTPSKKNALDNWIADNYTKLYNIEVIYRWSESLVDQSRYLYPPLIDSVQPALTVVKKLWLEPYSAMGDPDLVRKVAPRQLVLVGGLNKNQDGTRLLGLAEAGKRISLFQVDLLVKTDTNAVTQFIHTILHEYVHILNQTKPFDEQAYGFITPSGYTAQWYNENEAGSRQAGFITTYARAAVTEDFAEMASTMLTMRRNKWNALLTSIGDPGAGLLRKKEQIVVNYYKTAYNIDFYKLEDKVYKALTDLLKKG